MSKINVREADPVRYARVKAEQNEIKKQCGVMIRVARLCPYCEHKVENLAKGTHGYAFSKCPNCGEDIVFPPVSFRLAR